MTDLYKQSVKAPSETRDFLDGKGRMDLVSLDGALVGCGTFEPGWRWSEHVKPIAGTDSCQSAHMGYCVSGRMAVRMDDGQELEFGPGDFMIAPPGHDAWIIGDEPCVLIDWQGVADYAKR
ncbi:MAG: cupin domain-containing protein [Candidatus Nanopelagicales bacterium]